VIATVIDLAAQDARHAAPGVLAFAQRERVYAATRNVTLDRIHSAIDARHGTAAGAAAFSGATRELQS